MKRNFFFLLIFLNLTIKTLDQDLLEMFDPDLNFYDCGSTTLSGVCFQHDVKL
jgi:hypothetical protein